MNKYVIFDSNSFPRKYYAGFYTWVTDPTDARIYYHKDDMKFRLSKLRVINKDLVLGILTIKEKSSTSIFSRLRVALFSTLIAASTFASSVFSSGFLPEPVISNDPNGNIDPGRMYQVSCEILDERLYNGEKIENIIGGIVIKGTEDQAQFTYYYYLQDILDACIAMRSI